MYSIPFLDLPPLGHAAGTVHLPGSKSISNRLLLLAGLSAGTTTLVDLLDSDDTRVMLDALRTLGCTIEEDGRHTRITGCAGRPAVREAELFLGNAGTAMRPLTAALSVISTLVADTAFTLGGVKRMHERPIGDLVDALRGLGGVVECLGVEGYPPLRVAGGALKLDTPVRVRGDVSSQFLTALLMALPLAAKDRDIQIEVVGELISRPYIHITLELLTRFGIQVQNDHWQRFTIPAGSRYRSPGVVHVEADASSASYFIALGALAPCSPGHDGIKVLGVGLDSMQGDIRFVEAARAMGADIEGGPNWLQIRRGKWPLQAVEMDCNHIPDAAMTLAVMAMFANGTTTLTNIASWRVKETDRLAAMAIEGRKLGAIIEEGADYLRITPPAQIADWRAASIHTYDDHRVAMCFSLAAFNPAGVPVRIEDPKCVAKTFPDYFETLFEVAEARAARIPVICIDGPTASGKGTVAAAVAARLGYGFLDSGAMYRITAFAAIQAGLAIEAGNETAIADLARQLPVRFADGKIWLGDQDVTEIIRTEEAGMNASKVSALPQVRTALVDLQHSFQKLPGLVADGRDMGTVIFPEAPLKVFLTASAACRAERRLKQLISKGISANISDLRADLEARDARDQNRAVAPLKPAQDALVLDNSDLSIEQAVEQVVGWWEARQPFHAGA